MTYEVKPQITRVTPFFSEGGALAAVQVTFGPIQVAAKLYRKEDGSHFLSYPQRRSEAKNSWYPLVTINDSRLTKQALSEAVAEFEKARRESSQLVAAQ